MFFILTGFWHLFSQIAFDYQSPLRNVAEPLRLGGLEPEACLHLATQPLAVLGLSYTDPDLPALIGQRAGGRANLVAIACNSLIESSQPAKRSSARSPSRLR